MISALVALILVPSIKGFIKDSKISRANQNAHEVYTAAQASLIQYIDQNGTINTKGITTAVYQNTGSNAILLGNTASLNIQPYLAENLTGYFAFVTANSGSNIKFALWSEEPFTDIIQLSSESQVIGLADNSITDETKIIGCYPLTDSKLKTSN